MFICLIFHIFVSFFYLLYLIYIQKGNIIVNMGRTGIEKSIEIKNLRNVKR